MIDFSKVRGDLAGTSGVRIFCLGFATAYFITILVTVSLVGGLKDTCVAPDPAHPEKIELEQHGSKHPAFVCAILGIIGALLWYLVLFGFACSKKYHGG